MTLKEKLLNAKTSGTLFNALSDTDKKKIAFSRIFPFFFSAVERKKTLTNPTSQRSSAFLNRVFLSWKAETLTYLSESW